MAGVDGGDALTLIQGATFLGIVIACIRIAVAQADKRAAVAEDREKICTTALSSSTTALSGLTDEVRRTGEIGEQQRLNLLHRIEANLAHVADIRPALQEILGLIKETR